jgi:aryl-alcohol dehydrogenase-like predicted oxidoreductase
MEPNIKKRPFGNTGQSITCVGLGGEGILRTFDKDEEARPVIREAARLGLTYFDSAKAYAGSEDYLGQFWQEHQSLRPKIFQTSKSASRSKAAALKDLDNTLKRMGLNYLDLWQIHDVRTLADLRAIEGPGGALEGFIEAKAKGLTRYIGVTGHYDPQILLHAIREWPVDAVLLPVNPVEGALENSFLSTTLPAAVSKGMAVIGMKVLGAKHYISPQNGVTAELLIRYALSRMVSTIIVGCSTAAEVQVLASEGESFEPMEMAAMAKLEELFRPQAQKLAYYRKW